MLQVEASHLKFNNVLCFRHFVATTPTCQCQQLYDVLGQSWAGTSLLAVCRAIHKALTKALTLVVNHWWTFFSSLMLQQWHKFDATSRLAEACIKQLKAHWRPYSFWDIFFFLCSLRIRQYSSTALRASCTDVSTCLEGGQVTESGTNAWLSGCGHCLLTCEMASVILASMFWKIVRAPF